ncbi:MAG: DUF1573 domain-containing protein [Bacteroidaceae bacterium]|nr:DUF1573 domain-containing protein [Bacteroidaceae bacterium]
MKKYVIICAWGLAVSLSMQAQRISFEKNTVNAGNTLWKKPVTAVFKFTNKDKDPLFIREVDAGCGCLKPEWRTDAVMKGEEGEIRVTYDAQLLGHFDRYIDVYTNASEKPTRVRMKALVSNGEKKSMEDMYPYSIDDILLSANFVEFLDVSSGDSVTAEIEIYNNGDNVYTPQLMHLPSYLTAEYKPEMIARGRRGKIELTLHSKELKDLGLNQTSIYLARFSGDKVGQNNEIAVSAVLLPDLHFAEEFTRKPNFHISTTELQLGKMGSKTKLKGRVTISNKGRGVLKLSKIQSFNQAVTVALKKTELQPGEAITMDVTVDARFLGMSKAQPRVLIITNDPNHPKEVVNVSFER